jgi:poly(3-hydroxybutyrate) depolymerase
MGEMFLRPGTPDDDNRDYLPEKIKGSDIVVNENGNNSQPYPENLKEYHGVIADDGLEDEWYVYVPDSYDASRKTPLVISLHGGMMTGWGQAIYTSWTIAADRDGFIVLFPNANFNKFWQIDWSGSEMDPSKKKSGAVKDESPEVRVSPDDPAENHDVKLILGLVDLMKKTYNIDEGRVFMQGMSMGDMMTSLFARNFGTILAGAAGSGAASFLQVLFTEDEKMINKAGPLAIWQSRPELNGIPPKRNDEIKQFKYNRLYWMKINDCDLIPQISIQGENNLAFYKGKKADVVYYDIKNRDHGQTFDDAALIWDYFFSGIRREKDGTILCTKPVKERKGDAFAFAVTSGSAKAWFENSIQEMSGETIHWKKMKYHGLEGGQKIRGEYHMVPLSFLAKVFDAKLVYSDETLVARMEMKDGKKLQFARGSIGCVIDNSLVQMYCEALHRKQELYVSVEWFAEYICGMYVSTCEEVVYITDHLNKLSANMADLIKDMLTDNIVPENYKEWL